jgi:hypothetical protein
MITVLITAGHNPAAALIKALTDEPASHVALRWGPWVLHANFSGVRWDKYKDFATKAAILDEIPIDMPIERLLWLSAQHVEHGKYDFGGFAYIGCKLALGKIGIKLPKKNLWQMTGMHMCTEWITDAAFGEEDSMITPWQLRNLLRESK